MLRLQHSSLLRPDVGSCRGTVLSLALLSYSPERLKQKTQCA